MSVVAGLFQVLKVCLFNLFLFFFVALFRNFSFFCDFGSEHCGKF